MLVLNVFVPVVVMVPFIPEALVVVIFAPDPNVKAPLPLMVAVALATKPPVNAVVPFTVNAGVPVPFKFIEAFNVSVPATVLAP